MKHSAQLKVRFCRSCWREKYVRLGARLATNLTLTFSVKTTRKLVAAIVGGNISRLLILDLLPSSDDGGFTSFPLLEWT